MGGYDYQGKVVQHCGPGNLVELPDDGKGFHFTNRRPNALRAVPEPGCGLQFPGGRQTTKRIFMRPKRPSRRMMPTPRYAPTRSCCG